MIWTTAQVTLGDGKTLCPIEDLHIGQTLWNPLTGKPQDITDILKRSPLAPDGSCPSALMPHRIPADCFGPGKPASDIWLSPSQLLLTTSRRENMPPDRGLPVLAPIAARQAGTPNLPKHGRYAAIFLDQPGAVAVQNMTLTLYHISCLDEEHRILSEAATAPAALQRRWLSWIGSKFQTETPPTQDMPNRL